MTAELSKDPLTRYEQLRNDPLLFLTHCVFTKDEVDAERPIKPFPAHLDYVRFIALMWQREKRIAIPKSRRMTVSWTCLALITHDIIFFKGRNWAVTSRKEQAALELVSRIEFIIDHIPQDVMAKELIPKMKHGKMQTSPPTIEFPETHSKVQGHPQGGDQLRQYGFSGIFEDECAFQEESEETYAAAEPTVRGGGRFIKVSSRSVEDGGFFKKIVFDKLDATDIRFPEIPPVPPKSPMEGVEVWKNPKNGFLVIDLHYTANPAKRGAEFKEALKKALPVRRYMMEFEKNWMTFEGRPVYEDFNPDIHSTLTKPDYESGLPLLLGWDSSGLTPACIVGQLQEEQLVLFQEIIGNGMGAGRFVPMVEGLLKQAFPGIFDYSQNVISFFDPAGFKRNEITEETYIQRMAKHGFTRTFPGAQTWKMRVDAVTDRLVGLTKGRPKVLIYEPGCPVLVAGFKGGFRYSDKVSLSEPNKPEAIKDQFSHCFVAGTLVNTPTGNVPIESLCVGDYVNTPAGRAKITATLNSESRELVKISTKNGNSIVCTPNHPIWSGNSFIRADKLCVGSPVVLEELCESDTKYKNTTALGFIENQAVITKRATQRVERTCIVMCGQSITDLFRMATTSTTKIMTDLTMLLKISKLYAAESMQQYMEYKELPQTQKKQNFICLGYAKKPLSGTAPVMALNGIVNTLSALRKVFLSNLINVFGANPIIKLSVAGVNADFVLPNAKPEPDITRESIISKDHALFAVNFLKSINTLKQDTVVSVVTIEAAPTRVYDLTVDQAHCFFANGILASNCHDALQYLCSGLRNYRSQNYFEPTPTPKYSFQKQDASQRPQLRKRYG